MRLDDLARTATESLLAETTPDTESRLADLKRTRRNRTVTRGIAAGAALAVAVGGWAVLRSGEPDRPEPAPPTYRNGVLLIQSDARIRAVDGERDRVPMPDDYAGIGDLAFTADGAELLYENADKRVAAVDVETGESRVLTPCGPEPWCPMALSPDGRWLAEPYGDGIRLREMGEEFRSLRDETQVELATPGVTVDYVAWSPDGETLAFSSPAGLYTMSASGSDLRSLVEFTSARPVSSRLQWSPDGRTIAFLEARPLDRQPYSGVRLEEFVLRLVETDGGGLRDLQELGTCICVRHWGPDFAWAPDGTAIAATRVKARRGKPLYTRSNGVHLISLDGQSVKVSDDSGPSLAWQPIPDNGG